MLSLLLSLTLLLHTCAALDNGLAPTPPMGWLSWVAFGCNINCTSDPDTCVSEKNMKEMADLVNQEGYKDAGYQYIIIDDCWFAPERDQSGRLKPDPTRFPSGIQKLAEYVHNLGLKFGIYEDEGHKTCAGFPGTLGYEAMDAQTFASWDVDYVKLDGCFVDNITDLDEGYPKFRDALNKTGRPIVYSCEWPLYTQELSHDQNKPNYDIVKQTCNVWRNLHDIDTNWGSLVSIIEYFQLNEKELVKASGPGGWNDPDMLIIGNQSALTVDQAKVQMALWSIWSAPLIMSVDLRTIQEPFKKILLNKEVIAVDQDPLGIMGKLVKKQGQYQQISIYVKPMNPVEIVNGEKRYSYALAFVNMGNKRETVTLPALEYLGLSHSNGYILQNLFDYEAAAVFGPSDAFKTTINPTGVNMFKATVIRQVVGGSDTVLNSIWIMISLITLAVGVGMKF